MQRMARLRPRASAVPELIFSTSRCFTFFNTRVQAQTGAQGRTGCWLDPQDMPVPHPLHAPHPGSS